MGPRILIVEDDPLVAIAHARLLRDIASTIAVVHDAARALEALAHDPIDVVLLDVRMPGMDGTELLRRIRDRDRDLPVLFVTGAPSLESAAAAVEHRAFRYLTKPVATDALRHAVVEAGILRSLARTTAERLDGRAGLDAALHRALPALTMAYQPIVAARSRAAIGYEALMRSSDLVLPSPAVLLEAAEKLGEVHTVGRHARGLVATDLDRIPVEGSIFVNLHPADLVDEHLYDRASPLSRHAPRVVLELTERASLEAISELEERLAELRGLGYRLAVDDLGAGYAGLGYFARVRPDIVKIDLSLVRGVDTDPLRQQLVASITTLAGSLGMPVVAEGVETAAERDVVVCLGCPWVQGNALAEPGPPFPTARWV